MGGRKEEREREEGREIGLECDQFQPAMQIHM